jgi:hypothetical protein
MKELLFSPEPDNQLFKEIYLALMGNHAVEKVGKIQVDDDGSVIVDFVYRKRALRLYNDYYIGAVYIQHEKVLPPCLDDFKSQPLRYKGPADIQKELYIKTKIKGLSDKEAYKELKDVQLHINQDDDFVKEFMAIDGPPDVI